MVIEDEIEASLQPYSIASTKQHEQDRMLIRGRRKKKHRLNDELESLHMPCFKKKQRLLEPCTDKEDEVDKLWLLSLLPNFKGMPLDKKKRIKYEVQGLFIEMDNLPPA